MITDPKLLLGELAGASRIVLDLDGTLYDTRDFERPALASVVEWLRGKSGLPLLGLTEALWSRRETARHQPGLFDELLAAYCMPRAWGRECAQHFHAYPGDELRRAASLLAPLSTLRSERCRFALVTNGRAELQRRKLTQLRLLELFDVCVYCDPGIPSQLKPAVWGWQQLEEWRGGLPTVYAGDDPVDAAFAAAGAVRFVPFRFRSEFYED